METVYKLDTQETTARFAPTTSYKAFSDHSDAEELEQVRLVYQILTGSASSRKVEQLDGCRSTAWFTRHEESGIVRVATNQCHVRFCPFCSKKRQAFLTRQVSEWLETAKYAKMLTVTLKHTNAPLAWQIKNLYDYFRKFRQRSYLKKRIRGGVWFFQVKKSKKDGLWHPHIHALIDGDYMERKKLSDLWLSITFNSWMVDIKSIKDIDNAARHTARYAANPSALKDLDIIDACELVSAMQGMRLCGTWGTARTMSLRPCKPDDADSWKPIGSWSFVIHMQDSSDDAKQILRCFLSGQPLEDGISLRTLEKEILEGIDLEPNPPPKVYDKTFFD